MKLKIRKVYQYQYIDIVAIKDGVEVEDIMSIDFTTKEIDATLFQGDKTLKCVNIPWKINRIREDAFKDCTNLVKVIIPDSVKEIGADAFVGCTSLSCVELDNTITEVEYEDKRGVFCITEWKPFPSMIELLKEGYRVKLYIEHSPMDDYWQ